MQSRRTEADLVAYIGEVDARRLYAREACSSMFTYATERLHLSEDEAYLRITAARAAREHPVLVEMLADGRLHLSGIALLARHLTAENRDAVLARAVNRSKRQIEELVADLAPQPDVPAVIRKLPDRSQPAGQPVPDRVGGDERPIAAPLFAAPVVPQAPHISTSVVPIPPRTAGTISPLAPARYKVQFTASAELRDKLDRLRALMRSSVPDGDLAAIIDQAVTEKLERLEVRRFGSTKAARAARGTSARPAPGPGKTRRGGRHVPAEIRRAVWTRDGGQCRYTDGEGRRCTARHRLELHHRFPYGYGGGPTVENICLMCRTHNRLVAAVDYGRRTGPADTVSERSGMRPEPETAEERRRRAEKNGPRAAAPNSVAATIVTNDIAGSSPAGV